MTRLLNELRSNPTNLLPESIPQITSHRENDHKLEQCCLRLEQLTNKVDRLISFEQSGKYSLIIWKRST